MDWQLRHPPVIAKGFAVAFGRYLGGRRNPPRGAGFGLETFGLWLPPRLTPWGSISLKWYKRGVQGNIPAPGMRFINGRWETHGSEPSVLGLVLNSKTHVL